MESFLPTLLFKLRGLDSYPGGTFTHCSCQHSLDAHISVLIRFAESIGDNALAETTDGTDIMNHPKYFSGAYI